MKVFVKSVILFVFPILIILIGIELYIRNSPNSFITKSNYLNKNSNKIEILILGSSHSQNGINPKFFKQSTVNLGYGSQDIQLDSALFFSQVKKLKHLKKVIFELDYHRMDIQNESNFYRLPWYYLFYDIELFPLKPIDKVSLYATNISFFNTIIKNDMFGNSNTQVINKYGFVEKNYNNFFNEMQYDSLKIVSEAPTRLKNRHKELSEANFKNNKKRVEAIIEYCKQNNIQFYLLSSPLYYTYVKNEIKEKDIKVKEYKSYLVKKYKIPFLDFEKDKQFNLKDFSNEDHLNADGAKKYSELIDSKINE